MHGQHRRYRLLSRHIPSSRCQSNRRILARRNPCLFEVWTYRLSAAGSRIRGLVEPDGIEPTTSCLQSRRSPN